MKEPCKELRAAMNGLRAELLDQELWCLCAIALLLWSAN